MAAIEPVFIKNTRNPKTIRLPTTRWTTFKANPTSNVWSRLKLYAMMPLDAIKQ
jgi:hypothetical protein